MAEEPNGMDIAAAKAAMDGAAQEAATELDQMDEEAVKPLGDWMLKFYKQAGWRRLGRLVRERMEGDLGETL